MIIRSVKSKGTFFTMDNQLARNRELSLSARGLMSYILSNTDTWDINIGKLCEQTNTKEGKMKTLIKELTNAGFINVRVIREKGKFQKFEYTIYENPTDNDKF